MRNKSVHHHGKEKTRGCYDRMAPKRCWVSLETSTAEEENCRLPFIQIFLDFPLTATVKYRASAPFAISTHPSISLTFRTYMKDISFNIVDLRNAHHPVLYNHLRMLSGHLPEMLRFTYCRVTFLKSMYSSLVA